MKRVALIVPLAAAFAGCHSQSKVEVKNATVAEVANQVAQTAATDPQAIRAGLWSSTVTVEQIDAPGVPADIVRRMKSAVGSGQARQSCLTEEEAKNPKAGFFTGTNDQCKYDHFNRAVARSTRPCAAPSKARAR